MTLIKDLLYDLLAEITLLEAFIEEGEEAFYKDDRTQYAVMMAYARIGEIAKRLPDELVAQRPEAEWRDVKGFRDVLLHRYNEISPRRVWDAVQKLPILLSATEALLASLPPENAEDL